MVDFDGVIIKKGQGNKFVLHDGTKKALRQMKANNFNITVFTSRLAPSENADTDKTRAILAGFLRKNDVPFDEITAEKRSADYYLDDKAVRFKGSWDDACELMGVL
jgi:histidinol phosphatase-like enzyme